MNEINAINPEDIACWFFRINGCSTIPNFIVHPDRRGSQRTDVDVLAVRFPFRAELLTSNNPMKDHPIFDSDKKIDIILAEVKHEQCRLNGPWTDPQSKNMHRVLYALGAFPFDQVAEIADSLYRNGVYQNDLYRVRLFAVGKTTNPEICPTAVQLLWDDILSFIFDRFHEYHIQKAQHEQWNIIGGSLYNLASSSTQKEFINVVKAKMQNYVNKRHPSEKPGAGKS
ncbi:MAG: hypothetical protein WCI88_06395 [Chloroflexota bacterium]